MRVNVSTLVAASGRREHENDLLPIDQIESLPKRLHVIDGAICLSIGRTALITPAMWDHVECLWGYFINAADDYAKGQDSKFYFPDQPIPVSLTRVDKRTVRVTVKATSVEVDHREFFDAMMQEARRAMLRFAELQPHEAKSYLDDAKRAEELARHFDRGQKR